MTPEQLDPILVIRGLFGCEIKRGWAGAAYRAALKAGAPPEEIARLRAEYNRARAAVRRVTKLYEGLPKEPKP